MTVWSCSVWKLFMSVFISEVVQKLRHKMLFPPFFIYIWIQIKVLTVHRQLSKDKNSNSKYIIDSTLTQKFMLYSELFKQMSIFFTDSVKRLTRTTDEFYALKLLQNWTLMRSRMSTDEDDIVDLSEKKLQTTWKKPADVVPAKITEKRLQVYHSSISRGDRQWIRFPKTIF